VDRLVAGRQSQQRPIPAQPAHSTTFTKHVVLSRLLAAGRQGSRPACWKGIQRSPDPLSRGSSTPANFHAIVRHQPYYFDDRLVWKSKLATRTAVVLPSFRTILPCTTNFKRRTPSSSTGQAISSTISPRSGNGESASNKTPWVLMFTVLPDPVCVTMPWWRSL
jgi:hypothetical protein